MLRNVLEEFNPLTMKPKETICGWGLCGDIVMTEKLTYKIRNIRMSDLTWERFKKSRWESEKSWNLFVVDLINKHEARRTKPRRS